MPAGNICRISEAPLFGFPHTANICSPGCWGSTGFHGMASLVVKVPWVAPAIAPAAGVAPVPRSCAKAGCNVSTKLHMKNSHTVMAVLLRIFLLLSLVDFMIRIPSTAAERVGDEPRALFASAPSPGSAQPPGLSSHVTL